MSDHEKVTDSDTKKLSQSSKSDAQRRSRPVSNNTKNDTSLQAQTPGQSVGQATWGGRFQEPTDAFVAEFTASVNFDQQLAHYDIQGSIAHATMLGECGVLSTEEVELILSGLNQIKQEIAADQFQWQVALEDVHMNIEHRLTDIIGSTGKKLHTGRSRNDQVATDIRLFLRDQVDAICDQLVQFQHVLCQRALEEAETIMPGFTHLQSAQPITVGHHLLAWNQMMQRDRSRFIDCRKRINQCPLGSAALAGTSFAIDRHLTAKLLGFDQPTDNSLDSVSDRDFAIEFSHCASMTMMHLSRMAEELILWSSTQFNFISLPDRFCTGSSIMPQKKNPDVPELVRGKTGRVYGHLMNLLTLMKGQPLAYNKDNQEDKEPLFDTVNQVRQSLRSFIEMIAHTQFNRNELAKATEEGFTTATDLADYLVKRGVPFRDAHEVVGKAVQYCITHSCKLNEMSLERLQQFSPDIDEQVYKILTPQGSVSARSHHGGTAPSEVKRQATLQLDHLDSILRQ